MKSFRKIFILGFLLLIGLFTANLVYAGFVSGPIVPCGRDANDNGQIDDSEKCDLCDLWHLASNIINFISFNLAIPAAALLFVAAGVIFLISGGSEEKVALARSIFTNAVIGLVIIFTSWMLIDTLLKTLVDTSVFTWAWNSFPTCP